MGTVINCAIFYIVSSPQAKHAYILLFSRCYNNLHVAISGNYQRNNSHTRIPREASSIITREGICLICQHDQINLTHENSLLPLSVDAQSPKNVSALKFYLIYNIGNLSTILLTSEKFLSVGSEDIVRPAPTVQKLLH